MKQPGTSLQRRIDAHELAELCRQAVTAPRRRTHMTVHSDASDPVQRLFVALEPGSYIQPHRHIQPSRSETFLLLRGSIDLLTFDDDGYLRERCAMSPVGTCLTDIEPGAWHSYVCHTSGTLALEVKKGPYRPAIAGETPDWAPAEGDIPCTAYLEWMSRAVIGTIGPA